MRFLTSLMMGLLAIFIAGCSTVATTPSANLDTVLLPPDNANPVNEAELLVAPFDIVSISVFGVEELSGAFQVDFEGKMKMPLIGEFDAAGFTTHALAGRVEDILRAQYMQDPTVTARVTSSRTELITVDGAVENPGQYEVNGPTSLLQAVTLSGGPTASSNAKRVVVFRVIDGERQVAGFNLQAIRAGQQIDPPIFGNDVIVVDGSEIKAAYQDFLNAIPLLSVFSRF